MRVGPGCVHKKCCGNKHGKFEIDMGADENDAACGRA